MRVTDMVCWHVGMGMGLYNVAPLRLGYDQRQRMPRFFRPDDLNVPDVQQRVHWDPEWARRAGNPASYDYGRMRETWLIHLCTDWMGDDAFLVEHSTQIRRHNPVGDTLSIRGSVESVDREADGTYMVRVSQRAVNQDDELSAIGHGVVRVPDR